MYAVAGPGVWCVTGALPPACCAIVLLVMDV